MPRDPSTPIVLDASDLGFVVPMFIIRLRAWLQWCVAEGRDVTIIPPTNPDVASYLARMRVGHDLPEGMVMGLPEIHEHDRADVLIPATQMFEFGDVEVLGAQALELVRESVAEVAVFGQAIQSGIGELCDNGVEHGASPLGCFAAAQHYQHGAGGKRTVLAVGDCGVGIPETMRRAFPDLLDSDALTKAVQEGVTSTGNGNRGIGLADVMDESRAAQMRYVRMEIRSGGAILTQRVKDDSDDVTINCSIATPRQGTWVNLTLAPSENLA